MKATVIIERDDGQRFEGSAAARYLDDAVRLAQRAAEFNMKRRPGCTCQAGEEPDDRCNGSWMRCQGAINAHLAAKDATVEVQVQVTR